MKKDLSEVDFDTLVEHLLKNWHQIYDELIRWRSIIGADWNRDKRVYIT